MESLKEAESVASAQVDEMLKKYEEEAKSDSTGIIEDCKREVDTLKSGARAKIEDAVKVTISTIIGE